MSRILLPFVLLAALFTLPTQAAPQPQQIDIAQTVVRLDLAEGISKEEAIDSMKLRANQENMMFVAHQPVSTQIRNMGVESRTLEIFQFCDPLIARKMVDYNPIFAAYMPCRIAMVEDSEGKISLMMLNLDMLIQGAKLSPELQTLANEVNTKLMSIMTAGANGDL